MKKIIFFLTGLCVFSYSVSGQTLIPKLGFSITNVAVSEGDKNQSRLGLVLGGAIDYSIKDNLSLQGELLFIQKGSKFSDDGFKEKTRFNYLEIPVLLKTKFPADNLTFYANAGLSLSFALGGKSEVSFDGETETETIKFGSGDDQVKGMDLGFQIGGGAIISERFVVDLRYGLGLSNLYNGEESYSEKNRALQITVGIPLDVF